MSVESVTPIKQYSFVSGPNYSDSLLTLAETELAEAENVYIQDGLRGIPGAASIVASAITGGPAVAGLYGYAKRGGSKYLVALTSNGKGYYEAGGGSWTLMATSLSTATSYWDFAVFNDTLLLASGNNVVQKWFGSGNTAALAGTPPQSKYVSVHGDYVFLAGHTAAPSQIRYSDTSVATTWPIGNTLTIGPDDGQIITGLQKLGDVTIVFKDRSVWQVSGTSPTTFKVEPTLADVGCLAPNTIVALDIGIFYVSEAGPTLFNGYRAMHLDKRLKAILDTWDWTQIKKASAEYYPFRQKVLLSYARTGQSTPDRILLFDFAAARVVDATMYVPTWPILFGHTAMARAEDTLGRMRVYLGTSDGYVYGFDSGTTWGGTTITGRARTRPFHLGSADQVLGVRSLDLWLDATLGNLNVKYAADLATTFTTHNQSPVSMAKTGYDHTFIRLEGDGTGGAYIDGRWLQWEFTNATTAFALHGLEVGVERKGRRND